MVSYKSASSVGLLALILCSGKLSTLTSSTLIYCLESEMLEWFNLAPITSVSGLKRGCVVCGSLVAPTTCRIASHTRPHRGPWLTLLGI